MARDRNSSRAIAGLLYPSAASVATRASAPVTTPIPSVGGRLGAHRTRQVVAGRESREECGYSLDDRVHVPGPGLMIDAGQNLELRTGDMFGQVARLGDRNEFVRPSRTRAGARSRSSSPSALLSASAAMTCRIMAGLAAARSRDAVIRRAAGSAARLGANVSSDRPEPQLCRTRSSSARASGGGGRTDVPYSTRPDTGWETAKRMASGPPSLKPSMTGVVLRRRRQPRSSPRLARRQSASRSWGRTGRCRACRNG